MAKQLTLQRYIYKIHSTRLRKSKWDLTLPLSEARRNDEVISLADSQVLRWLDELNGIKDADERGFEIRREIRMLRREPNGARNRKKMRELYAELDTLEFKSDYVSVIMDSKKDFFRACEGFRINGMTYHRLLGTNGGVKNSTIVFISDRHGDEIRRRIENGRDLAKPLVPAKLEAYKALTCSASTPVTAPKGLLVVPDCVTTFQSDVIYIDEDENGGGEPILERRPNAEIELIESDGYGMISPALAAQWAEDLQLDYVPGGFNTRFSWEKGMVFCFDFHEFANAVVGQHMVMDAWGTLRDIREVDLVLTTSMVKLWDSYASCEEYLENSYGYTFSVPKVAPSELENEHTLNYQFIQTYKLTDDEIDELVEPTAREFNEVLLGDYRKALLYFGGFGMTETSVAKLPSDFVKAMMICPELFNDEFVRRHIYDMLQLSINNAKVGVVNVHGNYSIVSGDPYSLCQSMFGVKVTGLLKAGELYNKYWVDDGAERLACFRAPMSAHENIKCMTVNRSQDAQHWYQYMPTCTVLNSWDDTCIALNGMDKSLSPSSVMTGCKSSEPVLAGCGFSGC